jgi:hypothetical protein
MECSHVSPFPVRISCCSHTKANGSQCGSPALRGGHFCFFHNKSHARRIQTNLIPDDNGAAFNLPVLEDAKSIQVALMQVMRLILSHTIDAKFAGRLLFALQTAGLNLRDTDLETPTRERLVIDSDSAHKTPLGENLSEPADFEHDEEDAIDADEEESLDDEEDDEDEEDEKEDSDDNEEDDDSNEPEDEEEDGPPLFVENSVPNHATSPVSRTPAKNN